MLVCCCVFVFFISFEYVLRVLSMFRMLFFGVYSCFFLMLVFFRLCFDCVCMFLPFRVVCVVLLVLFGLVCCACVCLCLFVLPFGVVFVC